MPTYAFREGGCLIWHTFMEGCQAFGRPRRKRHLLQPGELREFFGQAGWDILMDDVRPLESDGRPMSFFLAKKPSR